MSKKEWKIGQIFVAFSEHLNFNSLGQIDVKKGSWNCDTVKLSDKELFGHPKIVPY